MEPVKSKYVLRLCLDCAQTPVKLVKFEKKSAEIGIAEALALLRIHTTGVEPGTVQAFSQVTDQICKFSILACKSGGKNLLLDALIESKQNLSENILAHVPISMGELLNGEIDINPALFLEMLKNNVKISFGKIMSKLVLHQKRVEKKEITIIEKRLALLKSNSNALCEDIFELGTNIPNLLNEQNLRKCKVLLF